MKKKQRTETPTESLRRSIRDSGLSLMEIARRSGVDVATLSRFMAKKASITLTTLDALWAIGLWARTKPKKKTPKGARPPRTSRPRRRTKP